ncbi:MAG: terminase [Acidobacteria bacterium]|nr:terminase [Acidobacteriota bacterium]
MAAVDPDEELIEDVIDYVHDPRGFVDYAYDWGEGELSDVNGPRKWQAKELTALGKHLQNPKTRFTPYQLAVGSGHGIGKSAFIGMVTNWGMSTCVDCKVVTTANTDTQLRTKTAPEVGKWFRLSITNKWFNVTATAIYSTDPDREKSWRADFVPWSKNNTEAFAGLHNKNKRIILIFDESSAIDDKVWDVAEGALTDENTEIIWLVFGNMTRATGRFRECFRKYKHRWRGLQIDSREVEGTNKEQIAKWVEDYGVDSDFVKVRVRGMPPAMSAKQFISTTDVDNAFGRHMKEDKYSWAPKILTVDPAWEGDDEFVIGLRQGLVFKILRVVAKNDNDVHMASLIAELEDQEKADAVFIDAGYGTGIVSVGRTLGRDWILVWFAEKSHDPACVNKRAEMWKKMRDWLKEGGAIPKDNVLYTDLIGPETVSRLDGAIQLESKKDMKSRGIPSPNRADCLALSFAHPVTAKQFAHMQGKIKSEYDPYDEERR